MHKKILSLLALFFIFSFAPVHAQENSVSVWSCMPAKKDGINKIKLFQKDLTQKGTVYIVDCIGTPEGSYCSTGNSDDDIKLKIGFAGVEAPFKLDNPQALKDKTATEFSATVDFSKAPLHTFYYVYFDTVDTAKTIKFSSINFTDNACANTVRAIPDYRFFDIASLEPLPDVRATLVDDNGTAMVPSQLTRDDGAYYYAYPDPNLQFKLEISNAYSYANQVPQGTIQNYRTNMVDYVNKTYTDKDVPLVPMQSPRIEPPDTVFYTVELFNSFTRVQGRVSIPYSILTFNQGDIEIQRVKTDKFGDYSVNIENSKIDVEQALDINYIKANLLSADVSNVQGIAINLGPEIVPISSSIEGYVYDVAGNIIPEGTIEVLVKTSDKVYYTTKANKDGFFRISADKLPKFEYTLNFYASESSINLYNYSDKSVQAQLLSKMQASTNAALELALQNKLIENSTYNESSSIFKANDPATIANKNEVVANQKAISTYFVRQFVDNGETGKLFGTDISQVSNADFKAKVQKDLVVLFENRDGKFADEFSQYFTDLAYSPELMGLVSGNNKDVFVTKMVNHLVSDIFKGDALLSLNTVNNTKGTKVLAAKDTVFDAAYFEKNIITAATRSLTTVLNSGGKVSLDKALAQSGKSLAKQIIKDEINNVVKDTTSASLLSSAIGAVISGGDVGKAVTNTARYMLISQGQKILTSALTNPEIDEFGKIINPNRGLSGDVAGPVVGFLTTAIRTGNVGMALKSAAMQVVQNAISKVVTTFVNHALTSMFGALNPFMGTLAGIAVAIIVSLLMKLLTKCS